MRRDAFLEVQRGHRRSRRRGAVVVATEEVAPVRLADLPVAVQINQMVQATQLPVVHIRDFDVAVLPARCAELSEVKEAGVVAVVVPEQLREVLASERVRR